MDWEEQYKVFINKVNLLDSKLIPIKTHLRGISDYFIAKDPHSFEKICNWFWMASSINSVEFDGIRYDCAFSMCRPAYEYEIEKQKLHISLINELTRFLYVYSAFEALLNEFQLNECPNKKGKINSATFFLKENYSTNFNSLPLYKNLLCTLRFLIKNSPLNRYERYFSLDECTDIYGVGLKVIYKIRNQLAHGEYIFPEPGEWSFRLPLEPEIAKVSTRLIILSTQMILISINMANFSTLEFYDSNILPHDDFGNSEIHELEYLSNFHIQQNIIGDSQLNLFKPIPSSH